MDTRSGRRPEKLRAEIDEGPEPHRKKFAVQIEETYFNVAVPCRAFRQDVHEMPHDDIVANHGFR